jgi:chemotaxis protein methyltransferase CheR
VFKDDEVTHLPEEVFRLMRDLIRDYCGIYYDDGSRYVLEKRLSRRVQKLHLSSFRDYYRHLLYDKNREDELASIIDILTVNETYFFREKNQLKTFSQEVLPELKEKNKDTKRLRIWSAGCSTGEEPYTIAMLILENGSFFGWTVEILGSDINQRVLRVARKGIYRKNSFRTTEDYFLNKYFIEENRSFRILDKVKQQVNFNLLNLLDSYKAKLVGKMDLIFCRNVLIYFDLLSRKKVVDIFAERLIEGGYLLLGHAESLINISTVFRLKHFQHDMLYQKPLKLGDASDAKDKSPYC